MKKSNLEAIKAKNPNCDVKLRANGSISLALKCKDKSKTMQEFKNEVNINSIMKKYNATGVVSHIMKDQPMFDDVSELMSLQDALNLKNVSDQNFLKLPSKIRARFNNSAVNMIDFLNDSSNYDEAVNLGLVDKKPVIVEEPQKAPKSTKPPEPKATPPK